MKSKSIPKKMIRTAKKILKNKKFRKNAIPGLAIAILSGATVGSIQSCTAQTKPGEENQFYTIALASDLPKDRYEQAIPLKTYSGKTKTIKDKNIVLVNGEIKDLSNSAMSIDEAGNKIEGTVDGKYLQEVMKIGKDSFKEYDIIYRISPSIPSVNLRSKPIIEDNSKITVINGGEFVFASSKTISDDNEFFWYPVIYPNKNGLFTGYIREDLLEEVHDINNIENSSQESQTEISQESSQNLPEIKLYNMIVDTSVDEYVDLKLRSSKEINDDNIISLIPHNSYISTYGETDVMNSISWTKVFYTDKNNNTFEGWVSSNYLKNIVEKEFKVDTSNDDGIPLNLRKEPNINSEIISKIQNGRILKILKQDYDSKIKDNDGREWVRISLSDNTIGFVSTEYLTELTEEEIENNNPNNTEPSNTSNSVVKVSKNNFGTVSGIDISGLSTSELRNLLSQNNSQIPNTIYDPYDNDITNISNAAGKINFVYIKIGASSYGANCPFQILDNDTYREQAKICEEFGVPYGFYYYSTCINENEANQESDYINRALESYSTYCLKETGKKPLYNILPIAIDVETGSEGTDRHYVADYTETSKAKAYLINNISAKHGNAILYTSGKLTDVNSSEKIMDINILNNYTEQKVDIWHVSRYNTDGNIMSAHQQYRDTLEKTNNIIADQIKLDVALGNGGIVDIDTINYDVFLNYIKKANLQAKETNSRQYEREFDD